MDRYRTEVDDDLFVVVVVAAAVVIEIVVHYNCDLLQLKVQPKSPLSILTDLKNNCFYKCHYYYCDEKTPTTTTLISRPWWLCWHIRKGFVEGSSHGKNTPEKKIRFGVFQIGTWTRLDDGSREERLQIAARARATQILTATVSTRIFFRECYSTGWLSQSVDSTLSENWICSSNGMEW